MLRRTLQGLGVSALPEGDSGEVEELFGDVDDGVLDELLERLKKHGIEATLFIPVAFDETLDVRSVTCASTTALLRALQALRPELGFDEDERPRRLARQRNLWKHFHRGARLANQRALVLELVRF